MRNHLLLPDSGPTQPTQPAWPVLPQAAGTLSAPVAPRVQKAPCNPDGSERGPAAGMSLLHVPLTVRQPALLSAWSLRSRVPLRNPELSTPCGARLSTATEGSVPGPEPGSGDSEVTEMWPLPDESVLWCEVYGSCAVRGGHPACLPAGDPVPEVP